MKRFARGDAAEHWYLDDVVGSGFSARGVHEDLDAARDLRLSPDVSVALKDAEVVVYD